MIFETQLTDHLTYLAAKGRSPSTIHTRKAYLNQFLNYLIGKELTDLKTITAPIIREYLTFLKTEHRTPKGKPVSGETYRYYITTIDGFFKWLEDTNQILLAPAIEKPEIPKAKPLPEVLTAEEVFKILESSPVNTPAGLRDRAILEVLYSTGIRRGELVQLNVEDFFPDRDELVILKGKGKKERVVPIGEYAQKFTEAYLKLIRPWQARPEETALFVSCHSGERIASATVRFIVKKAVTRSEITKPVSVHTFRHAMATHLHRNKADLRHIQAMLGHATLATTQIYTHLELEDLKQVLKESHPHGKR
jgi:integrase/recombinase XerD